MMRVKKFYDRMAFHCYECLFERVTLDGELQHCLMNIETGALTWKPAA